MKSSSNAAIAVFVKTPGLSPVKTRLAATIGQHAAEHFYRLCLDAVEAVIRRASDQANVVPYWSIAESEGLSHARWSGLRRIAQGSGELGDRLHRVYAALRSHYRKVLLVGADTPLITCELVEKAVHCIEEEHHSFAISRSGDGGYGLFAGRRKIPKQVWTAIPYSTSATATAFIERLHPIGHVAELPSLNDVDTFEDLFQLAKSDVEAATSSEQAAVIEFARTLLARFPTSVDKG